MTSLTESLREKLMHEATFMDASGKAAVQRCIHIITTLEQPTNDVERVARAIYLGMYNKLGANWDAVETKDVWFDLAKKAIAALTQQEDL